ncbi:DUF4157 domain-containing protein, partial [Candidatus Parcubacteria bacterium]
MRTFAQKPKATQQTTSAKSTTLGRAHFGQHPEVNSILHFQRTIGNQGVQWLLCTNDQKVVSTGATLSPGHAHDFSQIPIYSSVPASMQMKPTGHTADDKTVPSSVHGALRSPGQPLDASTRDFMEMRFGHNFSYVRVHTDAQAANSAQEVNALAYTVGRDIFFGEGQYSPGISSGQRLLAHELTHVVQQQTGAVPMGAVQRAPNDEFEVTLIEVSRSESDLLFYDYGVKLPGSPPSVKFGNDGPIPPADRKAVQLAFDLAYATAASPSFASKFGEFKKRMGKQGEANLPGLAALSQQKYLAALRRMTIHLADTSKSALVKNFIQKESQSGEKLPIAGFTPIGGSDVYIRAFALTEGRDALASLILHESVHVAGLPTKPINDFLETIMELSIHGFEASVGLPLSQIVEHAAAIQEVKPHGQGVEFKVSVTKPDGLPSDTIRIEIFD